MHAPGTYPRPATFFRTRAWAALLLLCFSALPCRAQDPVADSIRRAIATAGHDTTRLATMLALSEHVGLSDPDTNRTICRSILARIGHAEARPRMRSEERRVFMRIKGEALNNLAVSHFLFGELDSALARFEQAWHVHLENDHDEGIADALNNMGVVLEAMGDHAAQRRILFDALAQYGRQGDHARIGKVLNNLGNYYDGRGMPDSAGLFLDSALHTFRTIGDRHGSAHALLNLGLWHAEGGRPAEALEHYLRALPVFESLGDPRGLATCLNNIGSVYMDQGIWEEALGHFHRALDIHTAQGDRVGEANARLNTGAVLDQMNEWDMALEQHALAQAIYASTGDRRGEAMLHGHIGNVWKNKGDPVKAGEHFRTGLAMSRAIGDPDGIATALYKLAFHLKSTGDLDGAMALFEECLAMEREQGGREGEGYTLFGMGEVELMRGRAAQAVAHAENALSIAQGIGDPVIAMRATQLLHQALARRGQWKRALETLELHRQLKDSVDNAETAKKTVRLQMRHTFEKKQLADSLAHAAELAGLENERRIATLKAEQARNRTWAVGAGGLLLMGGGIGVYRMDRRRRRERFESDAAMLRTRVLRTRMNPHFIFNALISIDHYVQRNERELAGDFLSKFACLVRLVLENSRHDEVPLAQDLEALRLYMDLESARMSGRFSHAIDVDPAIARETVMVPPLVLQPFVENAIWHGIARKEGPGRITVSIRREGDTLLMAVEDDGVGRSPATPSPPPDGIPPKTSLGTSITRDRLEMLGRQARANAGFRYVDLLQGTRVEVEMPLAVQI